MTDSDYTHGTYSYSVLTHLPSTTARLGLIWETCATATETCRPKEQPVHAPFNLSAIVFSTFAASLSPAG